jgi:cysteine desulfurase
MARLVRPPPGRVTIYLDYQATTPLAPEAAAAMRPWLEDKFANPHSAHKLGREAAAAIEVARERIVETLFMDVPPANPDAGPELDVPWVKGTPPWDATARSGRLFFTSGATEALNWAIKGSFERAPPGRRRVVTVATEHAAVLDSVAWLQANGAEIVMLPVDRDGRADWRAVGAAVDGTTALVAAMCVNNEIGTMQHVALMHLAEAARRVGAPVVCDAVQAFGRVGVPVAFCDMIAISAHKIHGPKGIGALWVRNGAEPAPFMHGGGQEGGLRSGTLSPALCAGFGAAAALAAARSDADMAHVLRLWARARDFFTKAGWHVNGHRSERYPGNLNVRLDGLDAARLISEVRGVAFSAGSACASGSGRPSHVLKAIGLTDAQIRGSIRLGFGRYTTEDELAEALILINDAAARQL